MKKYKNIYCEKLELLPIEKRYDIEYVNSQNFFGKYYGYLVLMNKKSYSIT